MLLLAGVSSSFLPESLACLYYSKQAAVYDKCLRLPVTALNEGQIMNHISVDVGRIVMFFNLAHWIWAIPVEVHFDFGISKLV
jgi:hypothetical protein